MDLSVGTLRGEPVKFERLSTKPHDPSGQTDQQTLFTEWIWYIEKENESWVEFEVCEFNIPIQ